MSKLTHVNGTKPQWAYWVPGGGAESFEGRASTPGLRGSNINIVLHQERNTLVHTCLHKSTTYPNVVEPYC